MQKRKILLCLCLILYVSYQFGGETIITHYRWQETVGFEPA